MNFNQSNSKQIEQPEPANDQLDQSRADVVIENPYIQNGVIIPRTQKVNTPVDKEKDKHAW